MTETIWLCIGFGGQVLFTARFIVQWLASEREGRSVVPVSFWLLSIGGSLTLLAYALYRLDPVFIVAQMAGSFIYLRNLSLLRREKLGLPPKQLIGFGKLIRLCAAAPLILLLAVQTVALCYSLLIPADPTPANLGNRPANIAALRAKAPGDPIRFAVVGDIQRFGVFERLTEKLKHEQLDFLVILGDLTYPPASPQSHRLAQLELAECRFSFPVFYIVGNHDVDRDLFPLERWRETYGPDQFWFKYGDNLFVFIHAACEEHAYDTNASQFLENALRTEGANVRHRFVFNHVPLPVGMGWKGRQLRDIEARRLRQIVREHKVDWFISGDYHGFASVVENGTQFLVSGGGGAKLHDSAFAFHHATVLTISGGRVQHQLVTTDSGTVDDDAFERFLLLKLLAPMAEHPGQTMLANVFILVLLVLLLRPVFRRKRAPAPPVQREVP